MAHIRKQDVIAIWQACDGIEQSVAAFVRTPSDGEGPTAEQLAVLQSGLLEIRALLPERSLRDLLSNALESSTGTAAGTQLDRPKKAKAKTKVKQVKTKAKKTDGTDGKKGQGERSAKKRRSTAQP